MPYLGAEDDDSCHEQQAAPNLAVIDLASPGDYERGDRREPRILLWTSSGGCGRRWRRRLGFAAVRPELDRCFDGFPTTRTAAFGRLRRSVTAVSPSTTLTTVTTSPGRCVWGGISVGGGAGDGVGVTVVGETVSAGVGGGEVAGLAVGAAVVAGSVGSEAASVFVVVAPLGVAGATVHPDPTTRNATMSPA